MLDIFGRKLIAITVIGRSRNVLYGRCLSSQGMTLWVQDCHHLHFTGDKTDTYLMLGHLA